MKPTDAEQRRRLMAALDLSEEEPLPQSADREPPSEAKLFMARVVLGCVGLALLLLFVYAVAQLATTRRPT